MNRGDVKWCAFVSMVTLTSNNVTTVTIPPTLLIDEKTVVSGNGYNSNSNGLQTAKFDSVTYKLPRRVAMNVEFLDLGFCVENGKKKNFKTILKDVSGRFLAGQLTAIVGPSGAGKTTLMNILAGYRSSRVSGEILVNGTERALKSFRRRSCYIMQEDFLLPFLTIQESMESAATLKLGGGISREEKNIVIAGILETLNLNESRSTMVAHLSGGEKKRLSIALELINNPPVMFFDEPTSGLDSQNSFDCINLLKNLAKEGRTIICTIHQPPARIFEKFDHLYALSEGQCIYQGTIHDLIPFLSSISLECPPYHNPADFLIEVASGINGSYISQLVEAVKGRISLHSTDKQNGNEVKDPKNSLIQSKDKKDFLRGEERLEIPDCTQSLLTVDQDNVPDYPSSFSTQFSVLLKRTIMSMARDTMLTKMRLATHIVIGFFIGVLYYNVGNEASKVLSNAGCLYFSTLFLLFCAMMPTIVAFPLDMNVFIKEHLNHWYSLKAYYFAKTMADVPFQIGFSIVYVVIVYFLTNQPFEVYRFFCFLLLCILISLVAQSIGLAIGAALSVEQAVFCGSASAVPALLFSGFFVTFSAIPVYLRWLTYLSYVRYAYEGSMLSIYGMNRGNLDCSEAFCMFKYPSKILELTDIKDSILWLDFIMLFIYFLVVRGMVYFILRWKLTKER